MKYGMKGNAKEKPRMEQTWATRAATKVRFQAVMAGGAGTWNGAI
jgi:hypothetical protein